MTFFVNTSGDLPSCLNLTQEIKLGCRCGLAIVVEACLICHRMKGKVNPTTYAVVLGVGEGGELKRLAFAYTKAGVGIFFSRWKVSLI